MDCGEVRLVVPHNTRDLPKRCFGCSRKRWNQKGYFAGKKKPKGKAA